MFPKYVEELDKLERVSQLYRDIKDLEFSFPQRILYEIDDLIKEFSNSCIIYTKNNTNSENFDGECECANEDSCVKIGCKRTIREKCAEDFRIKRRRIDENRRRKKMKFRRPRGLRDENVEMKPIKKEICEPDESNSSLARANGSCQPERDDIFEFKPVKEEMVTFGAFISNFKRVNRPPSAEKEEKKVRFKQHFAHTEPIKGTIIGDRRIGPFFLSTKRKLEELPITKSSKRKRKKKQNVPKTTSEPLEPIKIDPELEEIQKLNSMLSIFKKKFYFKYKNIKWSSEQLVSTAIYTLKKCEISYSWRKSNKVSKLLIKGVEVSEGNSKAECCEILVAKLGKPNRPAKEKIWLDKLEPECLREMRRYIKYTPFGLASFEKLTKFVPKLLKFRGIMKLAENKMADLRQSLMLLESCCVTTDWESYVIGDKIISDFILDKIIVSEGSGENEASAWGVAAQAFLARLDYLIVLGWQDINRISSLVPPLGKGIDKFVVFEFPDACTTTTLTHSAYLNGVELKTKRTKGSYLLSLGKICIGGTCDRSEAGEVEARHVAVKYLRANCFVVQVQRRMISAWGVKTSKIESSFFMDWDYENEPQIFALSKPVTSEFQKYIYKFANTYYVEKLTFSPNFSEDEKQEITSIAKNLGLKVITEDHDIGPLLVVMGKIHPELLVQSLLVNGQASDEYVLIPPRTWKGI